MPLREIIAVITAKTSHRVIVSKDEMLHAMRHFILPRDIFLELLERILKDPSDIFVDDLKNPKKYLLFYRLEDLRYLVAVIKVDVSGTFLATVYSTGKNIKRKHLNLKRYSL